MCPSIICMSWNASRICILTNLQKLWRRKVEIKCFTYINAVSRHSFCALFRDESCSVVQRIIGRDTIFNACCTSCVMVRSVCATYICRCLLWIPQTSNGASCKNQPNTTTNSRPKLLHTTYTGNCNGWNIAVWMHLHSALFRSQLYLVLTDILYVWILIPRVSYSDYNMF